MVFAERNPVQREVDVFLLDGKQEERSTLGEFGLASDPTQDSLSLVHLVFLARRRIHKLSGL
jgi:hypothetical protein